MRKQISEWVQMLEIVIEYRLAGKYRREKSQRAGLLTVSVKRWERKKEIKILSE